MKSYISGVRFGDIFGSNKSVPQVSAGIFPPNVNHERAFTRLPAAVEHIDINETLRDIRIYLDENSEHLPIDEGAGVHDLIDKLVWKSNGLISLDHASVIAASKLVD